MSASKAGRFPRTGGRPEADRLQSGTSPSARNGRTALSYERFQSGFGASARVGPATLHEAVVDATIFDPVG
jgi:hypothetical protein